MLYITKLASVCQLSAVYVKLLVRIFGLNEAISNTSEALPISIILKDEGEV